MSNPFSTVNIDNMQKPKVEIGLPQMRVEFWHEDYQNIYGVDIKFNGQIISINEIQHPEMYRQLSLAFKNLVGKQEFPEDNSGIEVHILQLLQPRR